MTSSTTRPEASRLIGVDAIRAVCAVWVVLYHCGVLPLPGGPSEVAPTTAARPYDFASRGIRALIEGQSAVVIFFLISGLCIHFPYRAGATPRPVAFLARRYMRLGPPLAACMVLSWAAGLPADSLSYVILWSLVCEIIYYALYPGLLALSRRIGWEAMVAAAYLASFSTIALTNPAEAMFSGFGAGRNWLVGLPAWLLGCLLAERFDAPGRVPSRPEIWGWRATVWAATVAAQTLTFHSPISVRIGLGWSLDCFAILAFLWLGRELKYLATNPPPAALERVGMASYSIYLLHPAAFLLGSTAFSRIASPLGRHALALGTVALLSWAFYRCVELPSHHLSRRLFASKKTAASPRAAPAPAPAIGAAAAARDGPGAP